MYSDNSTWKVADAIASQRASVNDVKYFACSMYQPASSFLIGSTMIASLLSERGALLRGFSAGSYSCTAAAIVWKHVLDSEARLHVRIGGVSMPPPALLGLTSEGADYLQRIALALACQDPTELM